MAALAACADSGTRSDADSGAAPPIGLDASSPPGAPDGGGPRSDAAETPVGANDGSALDASSATCEPGTTTTVWASQCATTRRQCVAGTWRDPGSTTGDPLQCESAHFAVHAPNGTITAQQCSAATSTLETVVWPSYFDAPVLFPEPYCDSSTKWKASITIHADWGLTGGSWGDGYMGMWIGPGATADHWGLAHEFTHALQGTTKGLACGGGEDNFCGWIWESHANFMPHQLAEYRGEVHCSEMLVNAPHLYLGSTRDRYCNWQFMEFLKDKYCYAAVNALWTAASPSADPFVNLARSRGFSTAELNDFFGEWAMHNVTWDYRNPDGTDQGAVYRAKYGSILDVSRPERRLRTTRLLTLDAASRRYVVPSAQAPQRWGYNVARLHPDAGADRVEVVFRGVLQDGADVDFRWGLVATDASLSRPRYSPLQRGTDGALSFCVQPGELLFLVVLGTPSEQQSIYWDQPYPTVRRHPYMVELHGALPDGHEPGAAPPTPRGQPWPNGGGWVAEGADVAPGAYVGPAAVVLAGRVGAGARIEDSAIVDGATIEAGTVGGVSVLGPGFTLRGTATVRLAWPYGPGFFERPVSASGTAVLLGDLEYRGANTAKSSGTFCGFVDGQSASNCEQADLTAAPPYLWRP
jgi:Family of unknown function (DUF6055)